MTSRLDVVAINDDCLVVLKGRKRCIRYFSTSYRFLSRSFIVPFMFKSSLVVKATSLDVLSTADDFKLVAGSSIHPSAYSLVSLKGRGTLSWYPIPKHKRLELSIQMIRSLADVHRCGVIHGGVELSNFIYSRDGTAILTGFGRCYPFSTTSPIYSRGYQSPEATIISRWKATMSDDVWALGMSIYVFITMSSRSIISVMGDYIDDIDKFIRMYDSSCDSSYISSIITLCNRRSERKIAKTLGTLSINDDNIRDMRVLLKVSLNSSDWWFIDVLLACMSPFTERPKTALEVLKLIDTNTVTDFTNAFILEDVKTMNSLGVISHEQSRWSGGVDLLAEYLYREVFGDDPTNKVRLILCKAKSSSRYTKIAYLACIWCLQDISEYEAIDEDDLESLTKNKLDYFDTLVRYVVRSVIRSDGQKIRASISNLRNAEKL